MRLPSIPGPRDVVGLVERVAGLLSTAERVLDDVAALLVRIEETRASADALVRRTDETVGRAQLLLDGAEPSLVRLQPTLERLAETTDPAEVDAMVSLIDQLPVLATRLEVDVVPVLETLSTVAPDLHELLEVSRELNEMLAKLPGLNRIKRRVADRPDPTE